MVYKSADVKRSESMIGTARVALTEKLKDRCELCLTLTVLSDCDEQSVSASPSPEHQLAGKRRILLSLEVQVRFGRDMIPLQRQLRKPTQEDLVRNLLGWVVW